MSKIFNANNIFTEYNDTGHMTPVVKPYCLKQWTYDMEASNNQQEDKIDALISVTNTISKTLAELDKFTRYVVEHYPGIAHEYAVAQQSKARMEVPSE